MKKQNLDHINSIILCDLLEILFVFEIQDSETECKLLDTMFLYNKWNILLTLNRSKVEISFFKMANC
jgi:hypothetical protein